MQGYDFLALTGAGEQLSRADEIWNECYGVGEEDMYTGVNNRFSSWEPQMTKLGFKNTGQNSHDCHFVRFNASTKSCPTRIPGFPYNGGVPRFCRSSPNNNAMH